MRAAMSSYEATVPPMVGERATTPTTMFSTLTSMVYCALPSALIRAWIWPRGVPMIFRSASLFSVTLCRDGTGSVPASSASSP